MELQQLDEGGAELTARYDLVYKAVFQLELAALEALGQALADGLLDDVLSRSCWVVVRLKWFSPLSQPVLEM